MSASTMWSVDLKAELGCAYIVENLKSRMDKEEVVERGRTEQDLVLALIIWSFRQLKIMDAVPVAEGGSGNSKAIWSETTHRWDACAKKAREPKCSRPHMSPAEQGIHDLSLHRTTGYSILSPRSTELATTVTTLRQHERCGSRSFSDPPRDNAATLVRSAHSSFQSRMSLRPTQRIFLIGQAVFHERSGCGGRTPVL